jgi:hypothetical protein
MDSLPCPRCPLGELEVTSTKRHWHCAICGLYQLIPIDDDY